MRRILVFLLFSLSFAGDDLRKKAEERFMEGIKELRERKILSEEMMKEIEKYKKETKPLAERAKERVKEYRVKQEGGELVVEEEKKETKTAKSTEDRKKIYIFMSSSVPEVVWERYMDYVERKELPAVFLLRGCIGGCTYIKPTLEFIARVIRKREVEVWIDPVKFRDWGVKVVPCVAVEGRKELSCGDWSLDYHLEKLGYGKG